MLEIIALRYPNISTNNVETKGRGHEEADFPSGDFEECDLLKTTFGLLKLII